MNMERHQQLIASTEYLRGTAKTDECEPLFRDYKMCLSVRITSFFVSPVPLYIITPFPFFHQTQSPSTNHNHTDLVYEHDGIRS